MSKIADENKQKYINRYNELVELQSQGKISHLVTDVPYQVSLTWVDGKGHIIKVGRWFRINFSYWDIARQKAVREDVVHHNYKSKKARETYQKDKVVLKDKYNIDLVEVD